MSTDYDRVEEARRLIGQTLPHVATPTVVDNLTAVLDLLDSLEPPDEPNGPVLAARRWRTNGELIAEVAKLGYLQPADRVLDATYEGGIWWQDWRPDRDAGGELITNDVEADEDGWDFRDCPHPDGSFDVVAFDPPYVSVGGRDTSTAKPFLNRFGLDRAPKNPDLLLDMNRPGLAEMRRVVKPGGIILLKYQNQVWSGSLFIGAHLMLEHARSLGLDVVDWFDFVGDVRMQPERSRKCKPCRGRAGRDECPICAGAGRTPSPQQHARQNVSYLFVLRRPKTDTIGASLFDAFGSDSWP